MTECPERIPVAKKEGVPFPDSAFNNGSVNTSAFVGPGSKPQNKMEIKSAIYLIFGINFT